MNKKVSTLLISIVLLTLLACQSVTSTATPAPTRPAFTPTAPPPSPTPTLEPVTEKSLAGLLVSSHALGSLQGPGIPSMGLGIVNEAGELIRIADPAWFDSFSPSGEKIVYQHAYSSGLDQHVGPLKVYDLAIGQTVPLEDGLEGVKELVTWLDSDKFLYFNNYQALLFEAYGYFKGQEVLLADSATGEVSVLLQDAFQYDVSPDGTRVAYTTGDHIQHQTDNFEAGAGCFHPAVYDISSANGKPVGLDGLSVVPLCVGYPKWSPDGSAIAWIGYFEDDTFRPLVMDVATGKGTIYESFPAHAGSQFPSGWGIYPDADWIDDTTFWTSAYEVDTNTGKTEPARTDPFGNATAYDESQPMPAPNGTVQALLVNGVVDVMDRDGNVLGSYALEDLYQGATAPTGFVDTEYSRTFLIGWSPFLPPADVVSDIPAVDPNATPEPPFACPNAPQTRLQVGDTGRISFTDGTSTLLRSKPEAGDNVVDKLPEGTEFEITGGPVCYPRPGRSDAFVYWEVRVPDRDNRTGWVAEGDAGSYFIEPWP